MVWGWGLGGVKSDVGGAREDWKCVELYVGTVIDNILRAD